MFARTRLKYRVNLNKSSASLLRTQLMAADKTNCPEARIMHAGEEHLFRRDSEGWALIIDRTSEQDLTDFHPLCFGSESSTGLLRLHSLEYIFPLPGDRRRNTGIYEDWSGKTLRALGLLKQVSGKCTMGCSSAHPYHYHLLCWGEFYDDTMEMARAIESRRLRVAKYRPDWATS